jgi:hypothetical protein
MLVVVVVAVSVVLVLVLVLVLMLVLESVLMQTLVPSSGVDVMLTNERACQCACMSTLLVELTCMHANERACQRVCVSILPVAHTVSSCVRVHVLLRVRVSRCTPVHPPPFFFCRCSVPGAQRVIGTGGVQVGGGAGLCACL